MKNNPSSYSMCLVSGLLLGLSMPGFSWLPLGFLAWVWLVPLLFELEKAENFGDFVVRSMIAVGIGFTLITLWVVNASVIGLFASMLMGVVVWTIPLLWIYLARRFLNRTIAFWFLPLAWEWLYHQTEFSFGAVRLAYMQADMLWLIKFADLTGADGVTFWLVLVNISIFLIFEKMSPPSAVAGGLFGVFTRPLTQAVLTCFLFAVLLAYTAYVFLKPSSPAEEITNTAIQPNVSPFVDYSPKQMTEIFGRQLALTDQAVKNGSPDLILWYEVAVPYTLSENAAANNYLAKRIAKWNAPILTGLVEVKNYADGEPRPLLLEAQNRKQEFFNAAAII